MKKYIGLSVFIFLVGIIAGSFLLSCNISITDEVELPKPACEANGSTIIISLPQHSVDTEYINIYRQDVSNPLSLIENVGIIFPKSYGDDTKTYLFTDSLIFKDHNYKYYARYYDGSEYLSTKWTDEVTAIDGYTSVSTTVYVVNDAYISLSLSDYSFTLHGTIYNPSIPNFESDYKPAIILRTKDATQVFEVESIADGKVISIKGIIPQSFYDKTIELVGICGQKKERINPEDDESAFCRIIWTSPSLIDIEDNETNSFLIPSSNGVKGYDYSRKIIK